MSKKIVSVFTLLLFVYSTYAQWSGQSSSSDLVTPISRTGLITINSYDAAQINLNSQGTYFGKTGNPSAQVWSLGWGSVGSDINQVLNWTATGNVGIGTTAPVSRLHIFNPTGGTYLSIEKGSSSTEGGIQFIRAGTPLFYLWNDDSDDALKISASGLQGEDDGTPRMMFPLTDKNIFMALSGGNVGIGTTEPKGHKLAVAGTIISEEVVVQLKNAWTWPDYVFEKDYKLPSLEAVHLFINEHKHLPGVPSAKEVEENGLAIGEMNAILLKKIEELTMHLINQQQEIEKLKAKIK